MQTELDCIPCLVRQALEASRLVTADPSVHERLVRNVLRLMADLDLGQKPPIVTRQIHRILRDMTGVDDPYRSLKDRFNRMALDVLPELADKLNQAPDPLAMAVRLAIAGNVIDFGVNGDITEEGVRRSVLDALHEPFYGDFEAFHGEVDRAASILYLADNAGEIVFDRLLIEQLPFERVTLVVRGGPILNDATMEDAQTAGLCNFVEVVSSGSDIPGTVLSDCSQEFRRRFAGADLIISKGQGNFETVSDEPADAWFLLKIKCKVVARHVGLPIGTHVLTRRATARPALFSSKFKET